MYIKFFIGAKIEVLTLYFSEIAAMSGAVSSLLIDLILVLMLYLIFDTDTGSLSINIDIARFEKPAKEYSATR